MLIGSLECNPQSNKHQLLNKNVLIDSSTSILSTAKEKCIIKIWKNISNCLRYSIFVELMFYVWYTYIVYILAGWIARTVNDVSLHYKNYIFVKSNMSIKGSRNLNESFSMISWCFFFIGLLEEGMHVLVCVWFDFRLCTYVYISFITFCFFRIV